MFARVHRMGYVIYRLYPNQFRGFRNIDNPIYKKTTVDGIKLEKSRSPTDAGIGNEEVSWVTRTSPLGAGTDRPLRPAPTRMRFSSVALRSVTMRPRICIDAS